MQRLRRQRGNAMFTITLMILIMSALATSYADLASVSAGKNMQDERRYQARLAAMSGLCRAIAEIDQSVQSAGCGHTTASGFSCFGNIDGNVSNATVSAVANRCVATYPATLGALDQLNLDGATGLADGWIDFTGQSASSPGTAILTTDADGSYTVRTQAAGGLGVGGYYSAFRVRAYGIYKREAAGLEAYIYRAPPQPIFNYAAYSDSNLTLGGGAHTDSYNSGYPQVGGGYGLPGISAYGGMNVLSNGDVGAGGSITLNGSTTVVNGMAQAPTVSQSGGSTINGTETLAAPPPPPSVTVPAEPSSGFVTGYTSTAADWKLTGDTLNVGSDASRVSGNVIVSALTMTGGSTLNIYPAAGETVHIWIQSKISEAGTSVINVVQPATFPSGATSPGIVVFYIEPSVTQVSFSGNGITNATAATTSPATASVMSPPATLQFYSASTTTFSYTGSSDTSMVVQAVNASLDMRGGSAFFGAVTGENVSISGGSGFHYDESLKNLVATEVPPTYRVSSLIDIAGKTK